jgi:hypothetical protein
MVRGLLPVILAIAGTVIAASALQASKPAGASELLQNAGFESGSSGWAVEGAAAATNNSVSGSALELTGTSTVTVRQIVGAEEWAVYSGSAWVAGATGSATMSFRFLNSDLLDVYAAAPLPAEVLLSPGYAPISYAATAPASAVHVEIRIRLLPGPDGSVHAFLDEASLVMSVAPNPPTATPTEPSSETPTTVNGSATAVTPAPGVSPGSTTTAAAGTATPGGTADTGGLLRNGGFEAGSAAAPSAWSKFGGTMGISSSARTGSRAVTLYSDTSSTKWIYQGAGVVPGEWYEASGWGRVTAGQCELFIRLSWYASEDGSGTAIDNVDSDLHTGGSWGEMRVVAQAPGNARSVRVRLMVRPLGTTTVAFDDVWLVVTTEPLPPHEEEVPDGENVEPTATTAARPGGAPPPPGSTGTTPLLSGARTLRLSEFMSDPEQAGRDSPLEWVELVNTGTEAINLEGWKLGDALALDVLPAASVPAGGYIVVAGKEAGFAEGVAVVRVPDGEIGRGLNNGGDVIRLIAPDGSAVDAISYGDNRTVFDAPPRAPGPGETLGLLNPEDAASSDGWALTDRPSPGAPNTFPVATSVVAGERTPGSSPRQPVEVIEGGNGSSKVPWVILGSLGGVGLLGAWSAGRRGIAEIRKRFGRGS